MRKIKALCILIGAAAFTLWIINAYVIVKARPHIFQHPNEVPPVEAVIILGASVYRSGELSPVLRQRVETGLFFQAVQKQSKILFSGHSTPQGYNEPAAMAEYARNRDIPKSLLIQDPKGYSTYTSLFNCKYHFKMDSILIVSQKYHLSRAIYIARELQLTAYGLIAPDPGNAPDSKILIRELSSRIKDFILMKIFMVFKK